MLLMSLIRLPWCRCMICQLTPAPSHPTIIFRFFPVPSDATFPYYSFPQSLSQNPSHRPSTSLRSLLCILIPHFCVICIQTASHPSQGLNIIKAKSDEQNWGINLGGLARIWKGGCIIRAVFLDEIRKAYTRNPGTANLLVDPEFAKNVGAGFVLMGFRVLLLGF